MKPPQTLYSTAQFYSVMISIKVTFLRKENIQTFFLLILVLSASNCFSILLSYISDYS